MPKVSALPVASSVAASDYVPAVVSGVTSSATLAVLLTAPAITTSATITRNALTTTPTDGLVIQNTTAALVGTQVQISPRLRFSSKAWNAASETDDFAVYLVPAAGSPTTSTLKFASSIAGGAYATQLTLTSDGALTATGPVTGAWFQVTGDRYISTINNLSTGSQDGLLLSNATPALVGTPVQTSPRAHWSGTAWDTTTTTSKTVDFINEMLPVSGATAAVAPTLLWKSQINAGGYTTAMTLTAAGALTTVGAVTCAGLTSTTTATSSRTALTTTPTDGVILENTTVALVGTTVQMSPRIRLSGSAWDTTTVAAKSVDWTQEILPISGATAAVTASMLFKRQTAAGGYTTLLTLLGFGGMVIPTASVTPATPAAGSLALYYDGTNLKAINSAGTTKTFTWT